MEKIISFEKKLDFPSMIGEVTSISLEHNLKFVNESNVEGEFIISGTYKLTEASRLEEDFRFTVPADIILGEKLDLSSATIEIDDFYYEIENEDKMTCYIDVKVEGEKQEERQQEKKEEVVEVKKQEEKEEKQEDPKVPELEKIKEAQQEERKILEEKTTQQENNPKEFLDVKIQEIPDEETRECDGDKQEEELPQKNKEETEGDIVEEEQEQEITFSNNENEPMGSLFSSLKDSDETFATYSVYILRQEETIASLVEKYQTTKEALEDYNDLSNLSIGTKIIVPTTKNES